MKPNFALSLSFEGIRLLHRAADGWRVVGDVGLDSPDLAGDLADLRTKASNISARDVLTKLIIPNDQVKYITLDTGDQDQTERSRMALDALEGATPYAVSDLAYAISADGTQTHVAAVARETLAEAEAFAQEHHFHPVSWVAIPDGSFNGEPFFGATSVAAGLIGDQDVTPDNTTIVILGGVEVPEEPMATVTEPETVQEALLAAEPEIKTEDEGVVEAEKPTTKQDSPPPPAVGTADTKTEASAVANSPNVNDAPAPQPPQPPTIEAANEHPNTDIKSNQTAPGSPTPDDAPKEDDAEKTVAVGFASRRNPDGKTPSLAGATRNSSTAYVAAPILPPMEDEVEVVDTQAIAPDAPEPSVVAGFLSRRKKPKAEAIPAPAAVTTKPSTEAQRLTIFGARKPDKKDAVGGKPRFLGLILTAVLLLFLAGVAAWASVFMDEGLARLFNNKPEKVVAKTPADLVPPKQDEDAKGVVTASLSTDLSPEDAAVLDALRAPRPDPAVNLPQLSPQELAANYAVTGIWPKAPEVPQPAPLIPLEDLYITSIDPVSSANDAIALPALRSLDTDRSVGELNAPATAGTAFALDTNGLVVPTLNGAITPDGVTVFLGRPAAVPPKTPARLAEPKEIDPALAVLAKIRPQPRPGNLVEQNERSTSGGLSRSELAEVRPRLRPATDQAEVVATPETAPETENAQNAAATAAAAASLAAIPTPAAIVIEGPSNPQAVRASVRPDGRPRSFARIVERAIAKQPEENSGTRVASVAPRTVTPKIPTSASVARSATIKNAINLRSVNLIGVYGKPSSRRALVRLSNGRYQKVQVGDRIDGGRVSAIGDSELRYKKGSRNLTLKMPKS